MLRRALTSLIIAVPVLAASVPALAVEPAASAPSHAVLDAGTATEIVTPVSLTASDQLLDLTASGLSIRVSPPTGTVLQVGTMSVARAADATNGGLSYAGPQVGCPSGALTGTVTIHSIGAGIADADSTVQCAGQPHTLSLRVGTDRPFTAVSIPAVDAGKVAAGSTASALSTYTNSGTADVTVTNAAVTGGTWVIDPADNTCAGATLTPNQSCHVAVKVTPAAGADVGTITFTDSTPIGSHSRSLSASGVTAPAKPVINNATRSAGQVTFRINDQGGANAAASSYRVLRGPDAAHLIPLIEIPASSSFTDPDTADGARAYAVEAINPAGTSAASDPIVLDVATRAPSALVGTALATGTVLTWTAPTGLPADPTTGYAVYQGATAASLAQVATTPGTSWSGPATAAGTHAFFAVAALASPGAGPRSAAVDLLGTASQLFVSHPTKVNAVPFAGGPGTSFMSDGAAHPDLAVSPNGSQVAYTTADGSLNRELWVRKTDGSGTPTPIVTGSAHHVYSPSWSPDGRTLAYARDDVSGVTICRTAVPVSTASACTAVTNNGMYDEPSWLNGTTLVTPDYGSKSGALAKLTLNGAATAIAGTDGGYTPVVSPNGAQVAYLEAAAADFTEVIKVVNLTTGAVRTLPAPGGMMFSSPSWASDMSALYVVGGTNSTHLYRIGLANGGTATTVPGIDADPLAVAVATPDTGAPVNVTLAGVPAVTLGSTVTPSFSAHDALNAIASYSLSYRKAAYNGGYSAPTVKVLTKATAIAVAKGYSYCFSVRATDRAGNTSAATPEQCVMVPLDDRSLVRSSGFAPVASSAYYAGTAMKATGRGQTLTRTGMTALRQLTVLATACPSCGTADVLVGGRKVGAVNLVSRTTVNRKVFTLPAFAVRSGTVQLKVTSTGKTVVIDGLGFRK